MLSRLLASFQGEGTRAQSILEANVASANAQSILAKSHKSS